LQPAADDELRGARWRPAHLSGAAAAVRLVRRAANGGCPVALRGARAEAGPSLRPADRPAGERLAAALPGGSAGLHPGAGLRRAAAAARSPGVAAADPAGALYTARHGDADDRRGAGRLPAPSSPGGADDPR